jgi:sulfoxide reductase heme-binding subunit YedZ
MKKIQFNRFQWFVHIVSFIPLIVLVFDGLTANLTVNPIQELSQRTGRIAIIWLMVSLSCTPLNIVLGFKPAIQVRRALGLYAAFYAGLHFLIFLILDYNLNINLIGKAVIEKPFIVLGSISILILSALTITSTKKWMARLGKKWTQLHRLVYLVGILIMIHYIWALKAINLLPIILSLLLAIFLLVRIPVIRKKLTKKQPTWIKPINKFLTSGKKRKPDIKISTLKNKNV